MISPTEYQALLRNDFYTFMHRAFCEINPNTTFLHNWHNELIAAKLEACRRGEITRLIINVPPRSLKTHEAAISFPAFLLGHNPSAQIICASYAESLAFKYSLDCRNLMSSSWYTNLFPTRLSSQKQSVQEFVTTENGFRLATSVGGVLTGRGADFLIIDDPLKPDEALSETQRRAVNGWFDHTLYSRLNDKRRGTIIIIMQRLHEDDLVGHVLEQEPWEIVRLPAIAEEDEVHRIESPFGTRIVSRKVGEPLHPEREPLAVLEHLRHTIGEYHFAGQYQQRPAPEGGGMVKKEWFKTYRHTELPPRFEQILQSWDTANKITELSDFSVCTTWGCLGKTLYLLDVFRNRLEYPDLKRAIVRLASQYRATTILIEDKSSGTQLIQDFVRDGLHNVKRYKPEMEKGMRLLSVTSTIENGFVFLPEVAPWLDGYLHELTTFPGGKYDDQTDSTSQALDWIKDANQTLGLVEYCKSLAEEQGLSIDAYGRLTPKETVHSPTAINPTTGQRIRWDGRQWRDCNTGDPMFSRPVLPPGFVEEREPCPKCGSTATVKIQQQRHCNQCGHQWPPVKREPLGPTRGDYLNEIRWRTPFRW